MSDFKVTVLISGRGSNLGALIAKAGKYKVSSIIADNRDAQGLQFGQKHDIPTHIILGDSYPTKKDFNSGLLELVKSTSPNLVALAGFMRIIPPSFVNFYYGKLINIHPSLLPAYPGLDTHRRALENRETLHGCTVHYVDSGVDTGPIIAQSTVEVLPDDTEDKLATRVLAKEHVLYPWVVNSIARGGIELKDKFVNYDEIAVNEAKSLNFKILS